MWTKSWQTPAPGDSVYYADSGNVGLRGLGVTLDVSSP
jgi:hypothetical protein